MLKRMVGRSDCDHNSVCVAEARWPVGTQVVVMSAFELQEKLAKAREEVAGPIRQVLVAGGECALWVAVNEALTKGGTARVIPASETGAANVAYAARIAAVEAARPAPAPSPCACKSAEWRDGAWRIQGEHCILYREPGEVCDICGDPLPPAPEPCACKSAEPLPPKPVAAMTIEECAAELATAPARTWYVSPRCGHWYVYDGLPSEGWFVKCATALDAWRAAVRKLREEGS